MKKFSLFLGDVAIFYLALFLTLFIRYGQLFVNPYNISVHIPPFTMIFLLWLLVFYIAQMYDFHLTKNEIRFYSLFYWVLGINALLAVLFFYFLPFFTIAPKTNLFIDLSLTILLLSAWRFAFNHWLIQGGERNVSLIIGRTSQAEELHSFLKNNRQVGYKVVDLIDADTEGVGETIIDLVKNRKVRHIILNRDAYTSPIVIQTLYALREYDIHFYNLAEFFEHVTGKIPLHAIDQMWFLDNLSYNRQRVYELAKRAMDSIISVLFFAITLPFYPFIMLAIQLDSEGPIFYSQQRMGKSNKIFALIKFRTMRYDAEAKGATWAAENDDRSTRVGKFLRKSRIDELPQIWNVLKGEMSFVGPRPERPEFQEKLTEKIPFYNERHLVTPGLTGWAQIKYKLDFKGGMTIEDTAEKVQYDLYYIKHRSILLDIGILLQTISIIVQKVI
jgi:exopolysaccharide biosynthesis polyprenyl glycosylphosphotransferase